MVNSWKEDELLLTLHLYCRTPFGKYHRHNPEIIQLANIIGRTPSAVAMKASNFASLDPSIPQKGLANISKADRELWDAFMENSLDVAEKAEALYDARIKTIVMSPINQIRESNIPYGPTEGLRETKIRLVQTFFRRTVLTNYNYRCAISGLAIPELLVASHIIPWAVDEKLRANPTNGIALNALYDKAFDKHLISFDDEFRLVLSEQIKEKENNQMIQEYFLRFEGKALEIPRKFAPDKEALKAHRSTMYSIMQS